MYAVEEHRSFTIERNIVLRDSGVLLQGPWTKVNVAMDRNCYWNVAAGTFDTFRIVCQGVAAPPLTRVWYYAPRIGYYVRRDDTDDAKELTRRVELVAMRLEGRGWPPAARAGLSWAFQHALETRSSGETVEWQSTGVDTQVTIRPTAAHISGQSSYCRTFEQTIVRQDSRRIFPGVACREPSGQWSIPGFDEKDGATKSRS